MYYQFVSVTGRIMGKGIPAKHWETIAHKGFQLVYGSTANLFVDRHGNYIGYGPEARELVGIPDVETFCVLPWDRKTARVFCTLFRGREEEVDGGAFLTSDCRGNLKRIHDEFTEETGLHLRAGTEPEMMWLKTEPRRHAVGGGQDQAVLLSHRPVLGAPADHPQGDGVRRGHGARHDPGRPRGRARPARAELHVRQGRSHRRPAHDLPPDLPSGRAGDGRVRVLHAEAVHGRLRERLPPQHLAVAGRREHVHARRRRSAGARARSVCTRSAACWSTCGRSRASPRRPSTPTGDSRTRGSGRRSSPTGGSRTERPRCGSPRPGGTSTGPWTRR